MTKGFPMHRFIILIPVLTALAGCAIRGTEIPDNDAAGSDAMKVSPCACAQIEHQAPEFTWIG